MSVVDRRKVGRRMLALDVTVHMGGGGQRLTGKSIDLSSSGIFVQLQESIPEGRRVDLVIASPFLNMQLATSGTVVHVLDKFGVGIRFARQSARTRELLATMLDRLRRSA